MAGVVVAACAIAALVVVLTGSSSDEGSTKPAGERVPATLSPVPTNKVDGLGKTTLSLDGNVATVTLTTNGLLNGAPHAMHIHAGEKGECPTVEAAHDHNGHLAISTLDGASFYGHPRVALTTRGDIGVASILEFPRYPQVGNIKYKRTIRLRPRTVRFVRKNLAVIVVHGIDYNGNGTYDDTLGGSDLNPALSGEATAPALCGELLAGRAAQQSADKRPGRAAGLHRVHGPPAGHQQPDLPPARDWLHRHELDRPPRGAQPEPGRAPQPYVIGRAPQRRLYSPAWPRSRSARSLPATGSRAWPGRAGWAGCTGPPR